MRRVYAVIELKPTSTFDPSRDEELDELAEDLLKLVHGVASATVYASYEELQNDEAERSHDS